MPVEMIGWIAARVSSEIIPPSGPPFDPEVIAETARIHERAGFDRVLSLAEAAHFDEDRAGGVAANGDRRLGSGDNKAIAADLRALRDLGVIAVDFRIGREISEKADDVWRPVSLRQLCAQVWRHRAGRFRVSLAGNVACEHHRDPENAGPSKLGDIPR